MRTPVYLDNHSTTRVDPRVVDVMLPYFTDEYGNAGSTSHAFGWAARDAVEAARATIARCLNAKPREIIFTSGATESNNLAIRGLADRLSAKGRHLVSVATEHPSVLDPLDRLTRRGFEITLLPVQPATSPEAGLVALDQLSEAIRDDTILVTVMLANNEIGVIQPLREIAEICRQRKVLLHCDATQAVGRIPVNVEELSVDLLSCTAHKLYGPKGVGALYVCRRSPQIRVVPLIDGGGQERGMRSGTLNVAGIVGFGKAVELADAEMADEQDRVAQLRQRLHDGLIANVPDCFLNGPPLNIKGGLNPRRLAGNLNMRFRFVEGESLMMSMGDLAVSSGSACTSANPEPSHVLQALGLPDDDVRCSLRFGVGRFNTAEEIDFAVETIRDAVQRLRQLSSMA
jgi:cysteine desulfurase